MAPLKVTTACNVRREASHKSLLEGPARTQPTDQATCLPPFGKLRHSVGGSIYKAPALTRDHSRYRLLNDRRVAAIVVFAINGVQDSYSNQCGNEGFHLGASQANHPIATFSNALGLNLDEARASVGPGLLLGTTPHRLRCRGVPPVPPAGTT
jgi:hypothetical protein